ncbi:hypothetical protein [Bosea sp. (in: a-proteobacteria)]|uniref:hypothetical protein n=1 Tax=Bosea sp. (in: a-proteobacteria) TaxID=1871050 RepID=UPI00262D8DA0|nr:hypothetical protein [Bosea sp. (in: a-proteobacteria)]MCO5092987.1 hypothetical protein [Bosea sp. (in: a-proteobacteria)]
MPPPRNPERMVMIALAAIGLAGLSYLAWSAVGWFGVGLLGLLVSFLSVRIELEGNRPVGHQMTPDLYAGQYRSEAGQGHAERTGRVSERLSLANTARLAGLVGGVLALVGFGLFFLL